MHSLHLSIFLRTVEIQYLCQLRAEFFFFPYRPPAEFATLCSHMFCLQVGLSLLVISMLSFLCCFKGFIIHIEFMV